MKKALIVIFFLSLIILPVVADTQSGPTTGTLTDNSLVFKGYYQGPVPDSSAGTITLEFKDYGNNEINHASQQGTSGTVVTAVNNRHVGANTDTIFTWAMKGTTKNKAVHLVFSFSTLQAESNGKFYVPAYSITMTQNASKKITEKTNQNPTQANLNNDSFYVSTDPTVTIVDIPERANPYTNEVLTVYTHEYSGTAPGNDYGSTTSGYNNPTTTTISWYRSGTCTLNISNYENEMPGSYRYSCWVIAEFSVE